MAITKKTWGRYKDKEVYLFRLRNSSGAYVELTNYGAAIVAIAVPDAGGTLGQVILGFNSLQGYLNDQCYIGSTIGRFANRIANSTFSINGEAFYLQANDNGNSNHGGANGFNFEVFDVDLLDDAIEFRFLSADGEGGYPGNLSLSVVYRWTEDNRLEIDYKAVCDKDTIANFTNHAYFNLSSLAMGITDHILTIPAAAILEADENYIPTGRVISGGVKAFSDDMIAGKLQLIDERLTGLNDYYIIDGEPAAKDGLRTAAVLAEKKSGRQMTVYTTYPGLMLYTGDYLSSKEPGLLSKKYKPFDGLCLECQYYPDAPNHPDFPSAILPAGKPYTEKIAYQFGLIEMKR
jgi:aldose 1-epimerase